MTYILDNRNANHFNTSATAVLNGVKKGFLFAFGFALVLMLQVTFFSCDAIAAPLANMVGDQVNKVTQGVKTDMMIDKAAGITKEIGRDLRDGRTDRVIEKLADTSKDFTKEAEKRAKDLAKGAKDNIDKAKDMSKDAKSKIGVGVEKTKEMAGNRADRVKENTRDLPDKVEEKTEGIIDSVKNFLGQ